MNRDYLAFVFDDLTEFYAMRELIDALQKEKIPLEDKIKYYNILSDKDNEKVIKFLSKNSWFDYWSKKSY